MKKALIITYLLVACLATYAQKFTYAYQGVEFKCKVTGQSVCITSFDVKAQQVTIPAMVSWKGMNYPVKSVSTFLNGVNYLTVSLTLEEGIEEIDKFSFNEFRKLIKVNLPSSIRHIGKNAFRDNRGMTFEMLSCIDEQSIRNGYELWPSGEGVRISTNQNVLALADSKQKSKVTKDEMESQSPQTSPNASSEKKQVKEKNKSKSTEDAPKKGHKESAKQDIVLSKSKKQDVLALADDNSESEAASDGDGNILKKAWTSSLNVFSGKKQVKEKNKSKTEEVKNKSHKESTKLDVAIKKKEETLSDVDMNIPVVASNKNSETYCVIIANEKYEDVPEVEFAARDGEIFKEYCIKTLGIPEKQIKTFINASYTDIKRALNWMEQIAYVTEGNSRMILYYAGHGMPNEKDKTAYLIPVDGFPKDVTTCFKLSELYTRLGKIKTENVTVFLDACFSGVKRGSGQALVAARGIAIKPKEETLSGNVVVFTAASDDETALSYQEKRHGMFTYFLLSKLKETKGQVSFGDLYKAISSDVKKNSMLENDKLQTPSVNVSSSMINKWKNLHF